MKKLLLGIAIVLSGLIVAPASQAARYPVAKCRDGSVSYHRFHPCALHHGVRFWYRHRR